MPPKRLRARAEAPVAKKRLIHFVDLTVDLDDPHVNSSEFDDYLSDSQGNEVPEATPWSYCYDCDVCGLSTEYPQYGDDICISTECPGCGFTTSPSNNSRESSDAPSDDFSQVFDSHSSPSWNPNDPQVPSDPPSYLEAAVEKVLTCPILQDIMEDPVFASDGHSYDRKAILGWFKTRKDNNQPITSPITNLKLRNQILTPNLALKSLLNSYKNKT